MYGCTDLDAYSLKFRLQTTGDDPHIVYVDDGNPVVFATGPEFPSDKAGDGPDIIKNDISEFIESRFHGNRGGSQKLL